MLDYSLKRPVRPYSTSDLQPNTIITWQSFSVTKQCSYMYTALNYTASIATLMRYTRCMLLFRFEFVAAKVELSEGKDVQMIPYTSRKELQRGRGRTAKQ